MNPLPNWEAEMRSALLYRVIAASEANAGDAKRAEVFLALASEAENQAEHWRGLASESGLTLPTHYTSDLRARIVTGLIRRLGAKPLRSVLAAMKVRGMLLYSSDEPGHPHPLSMADVGRRHQGLSSGGNLRAAVFGANDGLVSNACLIMGVAGAAVDSHIILLTGTAGLLAGAFSMAAGEYVSVRSQREMYEYQIGLEREELEQYPEEEAEELALIYAGRGMSKEDATRLAKHIFADPERALDTLAREELGLNPDELGSPWGAAGFSFVSFAAGGLIPLLPFIFSGGGKGETASLTIAIGLTMAALFGMGLVMSLFTGRSALLGGLRILLIGVVAGGLTFAIGRILGVSLA